MTTKATDPKCSQESELRPVLFRLRNVGLQGNGTFRLNNVTLDIRVGVTSIIGYSGAGKTSLLNLLAGMEHPDEGELVSFPEAVFGHHSNQRPGPDELHGTRKSLPVYWAPSGGGLWPHLTVQQHLNAVSVRNGPASSRNPAVGIEGTHGSSSEFGISSDEILSQLDLLHRRDAFPETLSQGEISRLSLGRALASQSRILLLDEPLAHGDSARKPEWWKFIRTVIRERGISVVMTSHDAEAVIRESADVVCLRGGHMIYQGTVKSLYESPPDAETGRFLGPLNWFNSEDAGFWGKQIETICTRRDGGPVRPEWLALQSSSESELMVVGSDFCGPFTETTLKRFDSAVDGPVHRVLHRSDGYRPEIGDPVRLVRTDSEKAGKGVA